MMKRCRSVFVLVAIMAAGVLVSSACAAQRAWTPQKIHAFSVERFGPDYWTAAPSESNGFAWVKEEFKPESRIDAIRPAVEKAYRDSRDKAHYVRLMRANALDRPEDPVAVAKWAIVWYLRLRERTDAGYVDLHIETVQERATVGWLLAKAKMPGDAGYLRLRYTFEASMLVGDGAVPMGRKLLARYPDDNNLLASFSRNLSMSKRPELLDEALALGLKFHEREKGSLRSCLNVRAVYTMRYMALGHQEEDRLKEIEWTRRLMSKSPRGSQRQQSEQRYIETLERLASKDRR